MTPMAWLQEALHVTGPTSEGLRGCKPRRPCAYEVRERHLQCCADGP